MTSDHKEPTPPRNLNGALSRFVKSFRIREALRELGGRRSVLDLGCGLCELTDKIPLEVDYVGVERDPYLFHHATTRFPQRRFLQADLEDETFDPQVRADAVILLAVWEHLHAPLRLLERVPRWLEPGGIFVLTTPAPAAHKILDAGAAIGLLSKHADEEHERLWSIGEIEAAAAKEGWRLKTARRFLLGLNQLVVLERR
jgi:SAM-dependent methyltransferase